MDEVISITCRSSYVELEVIRSIFARIGSYFTLYGGLLRKDIPVHGSITPYIMVRNIAIVKNNAVLTNISAMAMCLF